MNARCSQGKRQRLFPSLLLLGALVSGNGLAQPLFDELRANLEQAPELSLSWGQAKQFGSYNRVQTNEIAEIGINLWHTRLGKRHQFILGVAVAQLRSDKGPNQTLHSINLMPQYRYLIDHPNDYHQLYLVLAAGPGRITHKTLGDRRQGSHFIFNDKLGLGSYLDRQRRWSLELVWRHFSNAHSQQPNDGIDIPLSVTINARL
jgi:hypothetical protein